MPSRPCRRSGKAGKEQRGLLQPAAIALLGDPGEPESSSEGRAAVWRTRDGGDTRQDLREGLPQNNVFFGVLRQAVATDRLDPTGVYFGTNTGALFASADEGETWRCIAQHLALISSVETLVVED